MRSGQTILLLAMLCAGGNLSAHAQGCSMCRDSTAGSQPAMRRSLRRAIPVLGVPAVGVFIGILVLAFRTGPASQDHFLEDQPPQPR